MNLGRTIDQLTVGEIATFTKTITDADVVLFAGITGDLNPVHVDEKYAAATKFGGRIVHGILLGGLVSGVLGSKLPGPGAIYVEQSFRFKAPVRIGDTVTASVEVVAIDLEKNRVRLKTTCKTQAGTEVLEGEAVLSPRKAPKG